MSGSLLQSYPQLALIPDAGLLGLAAYAFSTIAPLWAFATASVLRAWVGIGVPAVAMFAAAAWLQRGAA